jgi:uncharacterized protein (TIGR02145 family)/uncharacterized repeat protein (TIGR02543 family)
MKKFSVLLTAILMSLATMAQVPQGINYQTVIRDGAGNILPDAELTLQMTIRSGAPDGTVVYQENHAATTNAFGLVNLVIGYGVPQTNVFADINWGDGEKYLETAIDMDGGGSYTVLGVTQFLSVPYAIFSQKAATVKDGANPGEMLYWNGEAWEAIQPGDHNQTLRLCNGVPTWGVCLYNLDLIAEPTEAGTVEGAGQYEEGEEISVSAIENSGWEFVSWTDANGVVSEVANFTYTMPAEDVTLTANFIEEQTSFTCDDPLIDTRDGQTYETVLIGDQCWMAENLNIGTRINGSSNQTNNGTIEKYCYNNSEAKCDIYGGLYQWNEMMGYTTTPGVQGICPEGWHLPTDAEWTALTTYIISQPEYLCNSNTSYIAKALAATTNWNSSSSTCAVGNNPSANNSTGFTALPGGGRNTSGSFDGVGSGGYWWSSSERGASDAWSRYSVYHSAQVGRSTINKSYGFSVRCLKDETLVPTTYNLILESEPVEAGTVEGAGQYEEGEEISVSAIENSGWEFVNWTDDDGIVSETANLVYTMPAEDVTLTANFSEITLNIGDFYQGGIIAYILQPGDPGYVEGENHGIIAAPSDQSTGAEWGCFGTTIAGSDGTALGTGYQNTLDIVAGCNETGIAAKICNDLELNGYTDWYLPSKDELNKLYLNKSAIGGFSADKYWSSSEYSFYYAWEQYFNGGYQYDGNKGNYNRVRAVRAF